MLSIHIFSQTRLRRQPRHRRQRRRLRHRRPRRDLRNRRRRTGRAWRRLIFSRRSQSAAAVRNDPDLDPEKSE
jgi:hypothetical protein